MLELYQFEASAYSEKVKLILDYKQLPYKAIEVTPGVGQIELFQMSGQRKVPVLKDGTEVVPDSTEIALYLEEKYPERPLLPTDSYQKGLCLAIEDWADESLGIQGRKAMIGAFSQHPNFRTALLPAATPDLVKNLVGAVPGDILSILGAGVGFGPEDIKEATRVLKQALKSLCLMLSDHPYLVGDQPTLADLAVAGITMYIKFPSSQYVDLPEGICGKGVPGLADDISYQPFFDWRDRLYLACRKVRVGAPSGGSGPTSINID
ncbi:glutathione S-transferase family protein [Oscillatoria sp. CS-180]|uniref:glutathione S-transferase family protein n=1 Tax=Oscillatoria sp. CS-180 TaxID=3021720 RepID=UPI00232ACA5D|nr:glutathione S-transferase family protein [Oscillatoria sp. CS-180]MDB9529247.1 glutathione S-transferase family protein [Oscillatoria sp. CS-180]